MTPSEPLRFLVVCEAREDFEDGTALADRALVDAVEWSAEMLDDLRRWRGREDAQEFDRWAGLNDRLAASGERVRPLQRRTDGEKRAPNFTAARKALIHAWTAANRPRAVILLRDVDDEPERVDGFRQAREEFAHPDELAIVIGMANRKREAWVLHAFAPADKAEQERLAAARRDLGFDPTTHSHRLTAKDEQAKLSAKRVVLDLFAGNREAEQDALAAMSLDDLRALGGASGLTAYLDEVRDRLAPLLGAS